MGYAQFSKWNAHNSNFETGTLYFLTNVTKLRLFDLTFSCLRLDYISFVDFLFIDMLHYWITKQMHCVIKYWRSLNLWKTIFNWNPVLEFSSTWILKFSLKWGICCFGGLWRPNFKMKSNIHIQVLLVLRQFWRGEKISFICSSWSQFNRFGNSICCILTLVHFGFSSLDVGARFHLDRGNVDWAHSILRERISWFTCHCYVQRLDWFIFRCKYGSGATAS